MAEPEVNLDRLFGPMRPEADDEALFLKGYGSPDPEVLTFIKRLGSDERAAFLEFHNYFAEDIIVHLTGLMVGYHARDPQRSSSGALSVVEDEITKADLYLSLLDSSTYLPNLVSCADDDDDAEWSFCPTQVFMTSMRGVWRTAIANYRHALIDPEYADDNLPRWAQAYLYNEKAESEQAV